MIGVTEEEEEVAAAAVTELVEHDSAKAARILAVTRELMLKRGVRGITVAEIADKAIATGLQ